MHTGTQRKYLSVGIIMALFRSKIKIKKERSIGRGYSEEKKNQL